MNFLNHKLLFSKKNTFFSNIINVALGNGFGKLLAIAVMPLLTHLYSPIEFGELSLFISTVSILGVFTTLRYSTAIPLEKDNNNLINLIFLCFVLVVFFGILTSAIFYLINLFYPNKFDNFFSILICFSILGKGFYEILSNWCVKEKKFKLITKSKIYQSSFSSVIKLIFGYFGLTNVGLMIGHITLESSGIIIIFRSFLQNNLNFYKKIKYSIIKTLLIKYKKFPIFQLPSQLLMVSSNNLIIFLIPLLFGVESLGLYALAISILNAPLNVIGQSVSHVYYAEISSMGKNKSNKISELTINIIKKMSLLFFPLLIIVFFGESIFSFIFGNEWQKSGLYAAALCPLVLSRFIASPIMTIFNLYGLQEVQLKISLQRLVLLVVLFSIIYLSELSMLHSIIIYSFTMFIFNFYIIHLAFKPLNIQHDTI